MPSHGGLVPKVPQTVLGTSVSYGQVESTSQGIVTLTSTAMVPRSNTVQMETVTQVPVAASPWK